jgi:DNA-binding MarR family transcriptional regulator
LNSAEGKIVPNESAIFILSKTKSAAEVTLRSAEWAIITQIDGKKSVAQIAGILALSSSEALNLLKGLYQKELIEIKSFDSEPESTVSIHFFEILKKELTGIIGPVAPFIIDDILLDVAEEKGSFPVKRVPELVEMISDEISDDTKKVKFQQIMLNHIKGMKIS